MFTRLLAVVAFLFIATAAQAQIQIWSAPATACTPSAETVGHYTGGATAASVRHLGTETGTLVFTCGMQRIQSAIAAWVLKLNYRDSTGMAPAASVLAKLYSMPIDGFAPTLIASLSSNSSAMTVNYSLNSTNSFSHTFDFDANVYFVQITLTRAASSQTVLFHSVAIEEK